MPNDSGALGKATLVAPVSVARISRSFLPFSVAAPGSLELQKISQAMRGGSYKMQEDRQLALKLGSFIIHARLCQCKLAPGKLTCRRQINVCLAVTAAEY